MIGCLVKMQPLQELKREIICALNNKAIFADLVPLFFKNANIAIDWIHKDLQDVRQHLQQQQNNPPPHT